MKTLTTKHIFFTVIGTAVIALNTFAKTPDTAACLQLSGKILKIKTTSTNSYTVALMRNHSVVESKIIKGNNEFKFNLKKNDWYTVQILKDGYVTRTVSVDTKLAQEDDGFYKFYFDTELIAQEELPNLNPDALAMPIAHIAFDPKKHWFAHNADYTNAVKKKIYSGHLQLNK